MRIVPKKEFIKKKPIENNAKASKSDSRVVYFVSFCRSTENGRNPAIDNIVITVKRRIRSERDIRLIESKLHSYYSAPYIRVLNFIELEVFEDGN